MNVNIRAMAALFAAVKLSKTPEMNMTNRQWLLAERPDGPLTANTFRQATEPLPSVADKQVLCKVLYLSFEPAMRGWLRDERSYLPPVQIGEVMRAVGVAQIVASADPDWPVGSLITGMTGWQEYCLIPADKTGWRLLPEGTPPSWPLSVMGGTSMTAYFGLLDVGQPKVGETVLVSAAAGATGSMVCQIAKLKGCRVVGIAGGEEKCRWLREEVGVDAAVDYQAGDLPTMLADACPEGVDIFFDNVGGDTLEAAIEQMNDFGRIVACGAIAVYNDSKPTPGPRNMTHIITRRLRMQGFIMLDYLDRVDDCMAELTEWLMAGKLKFREDIQEGFDNIPDTLQRLFRSENKGKQLLKIADPE